MNKAHDISNIKGTYSKVLSDNMDQINTVYVESNLVGFKNFITELVSSNSNDTAARKNFLATVSQQRSKDRLLEFVYNSCLRGMGLGTNLNDQFAN